MSKELKEELTKQETAPVPVDPVKEFMLTRVAPEVGKRLPSHIPATQYVNTVLTALKSNPKLAECSLSSIAGSVMTMAQYGLTPLHGHAYMLPRWNGKTKSMECQFQIGYKGLVQLMLRTNLVIDVGVDIVHEKELDSFQIKRNNEGGFYEFDPMYMGDRGKPVLYIARAKLKNGGAPFVCISREDAEKHRDKFCKSKGKDGKVFGPWKDHFDAMASKTALLMLGKYLPISTEDQTLMNYDSKTTEVDSNGDEYDFTEITVHDEDYSEEAAE